MNVELGWTDLVVVAFAADVHQVQLVDQTELLQDVQGAVDRRAVQSRVLARRLPVDLFGVEVIGGTVEQVGQDLALVGDA